MHEGDKNKITLKIHNGLYRFLRMQLVLKIVRGKFQRVMDIKLSTVMWQFMLVYLDDVFIFLRYVEEELDPLQAIMGLLSRASLSMRMDKCFFCKDNID